MPHPNQADISVQDARNQAWYAANEDLADEAAKIDPSNYDVMGLQQDGDFDSEKENERSGNKLQPNSQVFVGPGSWSVDLTCEVAEEEDAGQIVVLDAYESNPVPAINVMRLTYNSNGDVKEVLYGKAKPVSVSEPSPQTGSNTRSMTLEGHGSYTRVRNPGGTAA